MDKFLCCLELEVVGILLGWLTIIGFGIGYLYLGYVARNHKKLRYFLALIAIGIFVTPIAVFSLQVSVPVQATITIIVVLSHIYAFMCILTLHRRIQNSDTYQQLA
ncbi:CLUMA_CG014276, isoform A [Clunio marinus]|uniref:CLUMA_CG014276, isoform A n=1 Tax=Clunio marinus TaxID=568069 RepID=A0A1J1IMT5_9DIPT|nr:CLUMA_CG014276, isoform A [Clunio marinus]